MKTTARRWTALPMRKIAGLMAVLLVPIAAPGAVAGAIVHDSASQSASSMHIIASNVAFEGLQRAATPASIVGTPPGRVLQNVGISGYSLTGNSATRLITTTFTLPGSNGCGTNGTTGWQSAITGSQPTYGLTFGFAGIWMNFSCTTGFGVYSSVYSGCGGLGTNNPQCPLFDAPAKTGDTITLTLSTDGAGNATTTWLDVTNGNTMVNTDPALYSANSQVNILEEDYCDIDFAPATTACVNVDPNPNSSLIPPFFSNYNPINVTSTTIDGESLASAVTDTGKYSNTYQVNSVYGSTLLDETSAVSGGAFSITDADRTLPSATVSATSLDASSTQNQTMQFTVHLSSSETNPAYVDYATQDDGAVSGVNYIGKDGTLFFPPGATTETVNVTILPSESTGGEIGVGLIITNPSYLAIASGGAVGEIYLGPHVSAVSPNQIPTDAQESVVVQGNDFGAPGSRVTVEFCNLSGQCDPGASPTVVSDSEIDVTSPNASNLMQGGVSLAPADTYVSNSKGIQSPQNRPGDMVVFGCNQVVNPDGVYTYAGCVYPIPNQPGAEGTQQKSNIDGVDVTASPTDPVTYAPGTVSSTGPVQMTLNIAGQIVTLFKGPLSDSLNGQLVFHPTGSIAGFKIAGQLTLTDVGGGSATGQMAVTLPAWLGGGTGQMTFTSTLNGTTVQNLSITAPSASFANLLNITGFALTYSPQSGWSLTGTATAGGGTDSSPVTGSLTFANNTLTAGQLHVMNLDVFSLFHVVSLDLTYGGSGWTGSASLTKTDGSGGLAVSIAVGPNGTVTSGSVTLANGEIDLFGAVPADTFTLAYSKSGGWTASGRSGSDAGQLMSVKLAVQDGVIQSANVTVKKYTVAPSLQIYQGVMNYQLLNGQKIFTGQLIFKLPLQTGVLNGIGGNFTTINGTLSSAGISLLGNVPVPFLSGVFITQFGATIGWNPPPTQLVGGNVKIGFGPTFGSLGQILSLEGTFTRDTPPIPLESDYTYVGKVNAFTQPLGSATVVLQDSGNTTVTLALGGDSGALTVGPITLKGTLTGSFTTTKFTLDGTGSVALTGAGHFNGTIHADRNGMAACQGKKRGFVWIWGQTPTLQPAGQCSVTGF